MNILRKERAEYPWLSQYLSSYALHGLVIASEEDSRIIPQRINYFPTFFTKKAEEYSEVLLLDSRGRKLARVGEIHYPAKSVTWWRRNPKPYTVFNPNETAEEAISRTETRHCVWYILDVNFRVLYV